MYKIGYGNILLTVERKNITIKALLPRFISAIGYN